MSTKRKISLSEVVAMLSDGKKRKEINEYYGLNPAEIKFLWSTPALKHKKPAQYSVGFELIEESAVDTDMASVTAVDEVETFTVLEEF